MRRLVSAAAMSLAIAATPALGDELVIITALPVKHLVVSEGLQPFIEALPTAGKGDLTVAFHPGGAMGNWPESFDAMRSGAVDGASVVDINVASELPLANTVSQLAMLGSDPRVMAAAVNELTLVASPALLKDWTEEGVRPLAAISLAPFYLMCTERVASLDDIKGKRVRADGAYGAWISELGATPVNIQSVELFEAMQRNQVDCAIGAGAWLRSFSLFEVVKSMTDQRLGLFFGAWALAFNDDRWQGLSAEDRAGIVKLLPGIVRRSVQAYIAEDIAVKAEAAEKGVELVAPSADLESKLVAYRKNEVERVLAQAKERGVAEADATVALFLQLVDKWTAIVAKTGDDYDAYEAALVQEIFSKI